MVEYVFEGLGFDLNPAPETRDADTARGSGRGAEPPQERLPRPVCPLLLLLLNYFGA